MEDNLVKKRMIHRLILAALTASLIGNINFVFADDGKWIQTDNKWWYQKKDGSYLSEQWLEENGNWYYFDKEGYLLTDWAFINENWYYFEPNGKMKTGWVLSKGNWYYLNTDGTMQTGWNNIDGERYYLNADGVMQIGWNDIDGNWYYLDESGKMREGWQEDINGKKYYFGIDGILKTGWFEENGKWYYGQTNGVLQTSWLKDGQDWYYFKEDGSMATDTWIGDYYVNTSGIWNQVAQSDNNDLIIDPVEWTEEEVSEKIQELRAKFPEGMYWNHMGFDPYLTNNSEIVTGIPCEHELFNMTYCNNYVLGNVRGYQCDGFARKMSDLVFTPQAPMIDYDYEFDKVKIGDYIRYNDIHTIFVIGKGADYIDTVEVNYGGTCKIHWDGRLSKTTLDKLSIEAFTRY